MTYRIEDKGRDETLVVNFPCGHEAKFSFIKGFAIVHAKSYDREKCPLCENRDKIKALVSKHDGK